MTENDTLPRGHGGRKARRVEIFVAQLISHASVEDAAAASQISASTGWRYLRDETVLEQLRKVSRNVMRQSKALLQAASIESVQTLRTLLRKAETESVQLAAAKTLLEMGLKVIEIDDIEERITAIEQRVNLPDWRNRNDNQPNHAQGGKARDANGHA
jgi:hypothetical protein